MGIAVLSDRVEGMLADYHNYTALQSELDSLVETFPHLSRIYSLGNSTQNRELFVIQISEGVTEVNICKSLVFRHLPIPKCFCH